MKFLKFSFLVLLLAIIADAVLVFAYDSPIAFGISKELNKGDPQWTPYKTKNTWTTQKYKNLSAITWLTNPCNSCQIAAKLFTDAGDTDQGVVTTPGHSASFNANTMFSSPDDWRLAIWRVDFTLLTTSHTAMWYINQ